MEYRTRIQFIIVLLLAMLAGCTDSESEKQSEAQLLVDRMVSAANKLDKEEYRLLLADDVKISIRSEENGQKRVISPSKNQYIAMLSQARAQVENYNLSVSGTQITVEGDKTRITSEVSESMKINGKVLNSRSREELTVVFRDGKPVVTEYVAYVGG